MDEDDVLKAGMEIVLAPVADVVADLVGVTFGDRVKQWRRLNTEKLAREFDDQCKKFRIGKYAEDEASTEPDLKLAAEVIAEGQNEGRDELRKLWAALLAGLTDPKRNKRYRREFAQIVKQLEPLDAAALKILPKAVGPDRRASVAYQIGASVEQVDISLRNLERLELVQVSPAEGQPYVTSLGKEFSAMVAADVDMSI